MSNWGQFNEHDDNDTDTDALDENASGDNDVDALVTDGAHAEAEAEVVEQKQDKPKVARTARPRGSALTRAQVQRVFELNRELRDADQKLIDLLSHVTKADADADELTVALLTSTSSDDALSNLGRLFDTSEDPFRLSAELMGMDRPERNRLHGVLAQVTGDDAPLPRDEISAAVAVAGLISAITDEQRDLIALAHEIRG